MSGLTGRRVLVTRARDAADALTTALAARGAHPISFPTIAVRPVEDFGALDAALSRLDRFRWIAFTSANAVAVFFDRATDRGTMIPAHIRIAAVGSATERAARERGARVDFVPSEFTGERLGQELGDVAGTHVLIPCAAQAREALAVELGRRGALVDAIPVYRTLPAAPDRAGLAELERGIDAATFTSGSTVENFFALLGERARTLLADAAVACIGPVTADAARGLGLTVHVQPAPHTMAALVAALADYFAVAAAGRQP